MKSIFVLENINSVITLALVETDPSPVFVRHH